MRRLIAVGVVTAALVCQARADDGLSKAVDNVKKQTASAAKEMNVKTKKDGCDGDRVLIKGLQQEIRELKLDLSSCKTLAGQGRKDCEQPLREQHKKEVAERQQMIAESRGHIACCENRKKKGCEDFTPLPEGM